MTNAIEVGNVLKFRKPYLADKYGSTATIAGVQIAVYRPFGTRTMLVDLVTANDTRIQWPANQVNASMK